MATMKSPPHPGRIVRQECLEPLGITITQAARALGVERQTLNNLVNQHSGVSPEMAIRLSKAFGSTPEMWLGLQMQYDLARAERNASAMRVKKISHNQPQKTA